MKIHLAYIILSLSILCADGQITVALSKTEQIGQQALVKIELNNNYDQSIKGVRIWVFMMDQNGKVVGEKAQWIVGGDNSNKPDFQNTALESGNINEYTVAVDTLRAQTEDEEPFKARVTFSRLILSDGTLLNPQKSVIASKTD